MEMDGFKMTPEEFNAAVLAQFQADKRAEWDKLEEEEWETAHGMYNDTMGYVRWKQQHDCRRYPDFTQKICAVCGRPVDEPLK